MTTDQSFWKRCSSCKDEISYATVYWVCSVSTCTRKRTGMVFCSVACWEMHLPMMRHREAYAVEERSPTREAWARQQAAEADDGAGSTVSKARRRVAAPAVSGSGGGDEDIERDILVVASKLKKYIRARSGMNTSDGVLPALSDHLRSICNEAIRNAAQDGRKTVLDRDVPRPGR